MHKGKKEGSPLARNIGIEKAKGEFIAFLDDDDLWLPEKIEKQIKIFENNNNVGLVICYSLDKRFGHERINKPPKVVSHEIVLKSFNLSSSSSYLVRKKAIDNVGGFDIALPSAQEYDLAIRLSKEYHILCVPEVLMIQHSTKGQISENWNRKIKGLMAIYNKHGVEFSSTSFLNNIKFIGMLGLFSVGFLIGNKIYKIIIPMKEQYEG
jgi:glycosyltransferase involved in cell wall biosynthesis